MADHSDSNADKTAGRKWELKSMRGNFLWTARWELAVLYAKLSATTGGQKVALIT
jgi:hypothetical protein